jgi:N-acetylglucosamine-6-phosphate deacetylase
MLGFAAIKRDPARRTTMKAIGRRYDSGEAIEITCRDGRIERIAPLEVGQVNESAATLPWIAPGLVDVQVNGYGGQEFSSPELTIEKTAAIVRAHDRFGVTRFCPTVTTASFDVLAHSVRTIAQACNQSRNLERRVLAIHVEGPYISREDGPRGAHPLEHCRPPDWDEFQRLQEAAGGRIRLLTLSPEYDEAPEFISRATKSGVVIAIGHTAANGSQIRAAVDAGARLSTHLGNGAHGQLRRHPNYLWDQLAEDRLTASLIVDGHHLPSETVKTFVRAKTPDRCILVSDESGMAGLPPGRYETQLCVLEILDDGRIVLAGQGQLLAGASAPIGVGVANVMRMAGVDLKDAIEMASLRPARLLGDSCDGLKQGERADLVLFDLAEADLHVRETIVSGDVVYRDGEGGAGAANRNG